MNNSNRTGNLSFVASNGGSMTLGHGIYTTGNVVQQQGVSGEQLANILSQIISSHPTLAKEEKNNLTEKLKHALITAKSLAELAIALVSIFKSIS